MILKWRKFLSFGNSKAGHSSVQTGHCLHLLCSHVRLEKLLYAQTTKFFSTPAHTCLYFALRTEDVMKFCEARLEQKNKGKRPKI